MDGAFLAVPATPPSRSIEHQLKTIAARRFGKSRRVTTLVKTGRTAEVIIRVTREKDIDLIVLATHGRTGLSRVLMGSTAEQVVRHARCPVWVVRSDLDKNRNK